MRKGRVTKAQTVNMPYEAATGSVADIEKYNNPNRHLHWHVESANEITKCIGADLNASASKGLANEPSRLH